MDLRVFVALSLMCVAFHAGSAYDAAKEEILGNTASLECPYTGDKNEVNWTSPAGQQLTHGELTLTSDSRFDVIHSTSERWYLRIHNVSLADSGEYTCVSNNSADVHVVDLIVKEPTANDAASNMTLTTSATSATTEDASKCSDTRPCANSGSCENGVCKCPGGFIGNFCEVSTECDDGYCNRNNTLNCTKGYSNGEIVNQCKCLPFYEGTKCEIYNICKKMPCQNKGICTPVKSVKGYECKCRVYGDPNNDCRLNEKDECRDNPPISSQSYITCIDLIESYRMYCSPGNLGRGCRNSEDSELYCDRNGPGYCTDEGYCKPFCNVDICNGTENCNFTADPYNTNGFKHETNCIMSFGDGYSDSECNNETTLFDGFDEQLNKLKDCSPFFNTICTMKFGNGICDSGCDTEECLWDGYDCHSDKRPEQDLTGVVIVELKGALEHPLNEIEKNISLMLRSMVNITEEDIINKTATVLSIKIKEGVFTEVLYAGKFLAAAVAKRPVWLERVKIKDIYVCPAGMYGDKCAKNCSTCKQNEEVCDWKNGECLSECPKAHGGQFCEPCDTCNQTGEVCDPMSGDCLHGCKTGHWGSKCTPCRSSCKQIGNVCNNDTGECLHGCISNEFYTSKCIQCPNNCVGGCDDKGRCKACSGGYYGEMCTMACDSHCQNGTCHIVTSHCLCQSSYYWSTTGNYCKKCSDGCQDVCDSVSGNCQCKDGFYSNTCDLICSKSCLNKKCHANGTCVDGCLPGFHGYACNKACPAGCTECTIDAGLCSGHCRPGFEGSNCEKSSQTSNMDDSTDNTGIIIGVIISLLLVCLILVVACCYWKKRQSGDYVMEDEEMEDPPQKDSTNAVSVHTNTHMQPSSPLLGHSMDMIELDEKQTFAVYAGPSRGSAGESTSNGNGPEVKNTEDKNVNAPDDNVNDTEETANGKADDSGSKERCTSSVMMEIGKGGRVLSMSDGDDNQSPTDTKEVEVPIGEENNDEDDSAFADPPHSPLGEVRAPLASEENILASLGPKEMETDDADQPADLADETKEEESKRSRSSSSSSSSSKSSKSSSEITTEM